jgi:hypothetical protein
MLTKFDIKWSERLEKIEVIFDAEILTKEILRMNKSIEPKLISIGASHQVSVRLAKQFQRKRFTEIDQ